MTDDNRDHRGDYRKGGDGRRPSKKPYSGGGGGHRNHSDRSNGNGYGHRDGKPRYGDGRPRGRDDHGKDFRPRDGDGDHRPRNRDDRPREDRRRDDRDRDFRSRGHGNGDGRGHRDRDSGRRDFRDDRRDPEPQEQKLTIPSTPQKILFKGIDCEVNGRKDLAMLLYLTGAARLSGGCESNATRMLRDMGSKEFKTVRGRVAKECTDDVLVEFDYICLTIDSGYDREFLDASAAAGDPLAIYCRIRLDEIDGEDPCIDTFASSIEGNEQMVEDGLKLLKRRRDSTKAARYLEINEERKKLRQSIRGTFVKAMKGDAEAIDSLDGLAEEFPEAGFLKGYTEVPEDGREQYLMDGMPAFGDTILSMAQEFGIPDTAFGKYLYAKKLQVGEGDWIQPMISAVKAGSEMAMEELRPVQNRRDVRKSLASIYLANGDVVALVRSYDGEDATYLDEYCSGSPSRVLEVGRLMGGVKEIDWLKRGYLGGNAECRDALISLAAEEDRRCKQLVYTLHDVGAELHAAQLYFAMGDDPSLPAIKWLRKVCADEEAKEFVRMHFEAIDDLETFESIFAEDGYENRHSDRRGGRPGKKPGYGKRGGNGRW